MKPVGNQFWRMTRLVVPAVLGLVYIYVDYFVNHNLSMDEFVLICVVEFYLLHLDRAQEKLRVALEREGDFVSLVSHQLRLPLTQLSWSLDSVLEDVQLTDEKRKVVREMRDILRGTVRLVTDLLNDSRIARGVLKMDLEMVPLTALIDETIVVLRNAAREKGAVIEVDVPAQLSAYVDKTKAIEAIRNIIDNAITYGPPGGAVGVAARQAGDSVNITVTDRGPGIASALQARLFDKASKFAEKREGKGAGLGLYLTKQFIELMGGTVRFETSSKGTVFTVTVPMRKQGT